MEKIAFISLGCDKNLIDSEIMLGIINEKGYIITEEEKEADIIIVNSCGFIAEANSEAIENILRVAEYKEDKLKVLIVTGCMAQRYEKEIMEEIPEVDAVVGTGDFEKIGEVIEDSLKGEKVVLVTDKNNSLNEENAYKRMLSTIGGFAYLKIAEGCDNYCTYCTIPSLRGKYRSRSMESLIKEAEMLSRKGVREIILIAQDTALYGTDLYKENKLHELLRKISEIENIKWIRILYAYPEHITDETIREMAVNEKICHYLDMPVQHGDDAILKLMGRRNNQEKLRTVIKKLRENIPDICLRTTLITGFPTESEENFNNLVSFVRETEFDRLGVFTYSREEGTPAYSMEGQVDEDIKLERKEYILELQKTISAKKCQEQIGKELEVIIEGLIEGEENIYCGRSYRDCYEVDGFVFFESKDALLAGDFVKVKITSSSDYDLYGSLIEG